MKFSHSLIGKIVDVKSKEDLIDSLLMYAFEAEHISADTLNVEIPHNRYADAASHLGVAREYAAISGKKLTEPKIQTVFYGSKVGIGNLSIKIENDKLCPRYGGAYFELPKKGTTPLWMKKILKDCGLKTIFPVVDILNYVMLEVGQPLHAFDADKLKGGIIVRNAKDGEPITTIDGQKFKLSKDMLVIADEKIPQAIAGIKGGKFSEVDGKTKNILVEAANFDRVSVYKTSRSLNLTTDASARFAHGMSPESVEIGLGRVRVLLEEILGAKFVGAVDVYKKPVGKGILGFNVNSFNGLTGLTLGKTEITKKLKSLGFEILPSRNKKDDFLVEVPPLRTDITIFEDLVEEVARLYGLDRLKPVAPLVSISQAKEEDSIIFKDKIKQALTAAGFTEVYNYSFASVKDSGSYELEKPLSEYKKYMRQSLGAGLLANLDSNSRFYKDIRIFEVGNVFDKSKGERTFLGIAAKHATVDPFLEIKGTVEKLLHRLGLVEFILAPKGVDLEIKSGKETLGVISIAGKNTAVAEIDLSKLLTLVVGEYEFREIPKYPAVMRDLSVQMETVTRVGEILNAIEGAGAENVQDVDLIDYYSSKMFTFRIIFQSKEGTLKDKDVNKEFDKITANLKRKFKLIIR